MVRNEIDKNNQIVWQSIAKNPAHYIKDAQRYYKEAKKVEYQKGMANALLNQAWCYIYLNNYEKAYSYIHRAEPIFQKTSDQEGYARLRNAEGVIFHDLGNLTKAIDYYLEGHKLAKKADLIDREAAALINIGEIYLETHDYQQALDLLREAETLIPQTGNPQHLCIVQTDLGAAYFYLSQVKIAYRTIQKALNDIETYGYTSIEIKARRILGEILRTDKDFKGAEKQLEKAISIAEAINAGYEKIEVTLDLCTLYLEDLRNKQTARELALAACREACHISATKLISETNKFLGRLYESEKRHGQALAFYKKHMESYRAYMDEQTKTKTRGLALELDVEKTKKNAEIYRLKNIELQEKNLQIQEAYQHIKIINDIGKAVTNSLDSDRVFGTIYNSLSSIISVSAIGIAYFDHQAKLIRYLYIIENNHVIPQKKLPVIQYDSHDSFAAHVLRENKVCILDDIEHEFHKFTVTRNTVGETAGSCIFLPLNVENKQIGLFTVQGPKANAFNQSQKEIIIGLTDAISIALANILNHQEVLRLNATLTREKHELKAANQKIQQLAHYDELSGLAQRNLFMTVLEKSIEYSKRNKFGLALIFLDLDNFKEINDRFGHAAGDYVITAIGPRLQQAIRSSDTVARFGGDEFLFLLQNINTTDKATQVVDKITHEIEKPIAYDAETFFIHGSFGIALFPQDADTADELLSVADKKMYKIKVSRKSG